MRTSRSTPNEVPTGLAPQRRISAQASVFLSPKSAWSVRRSIIFDSECSSNATTSGIRRIHSIGPGMVFPSIQGWRTHVHRRGDIRAQKEKPGGRTRERVQPPGYRFEWKRVDVLSPLGFCLPLAEEQSRSE